MAYRMLHFFTNRELNELYASMAIRTFGLSLISVFVPIYLLQLGYTLSYVLLFYVGINATHALLVIPSAKVSSRWGVKHTIFLSIPFLIAFYALLYTIETYQWPLPFLAVCWGVNNALFWTNYHIDFANSSDTLHRGKQVSIGRTMTKIVQGVGPVFGGLIATFIGFKALFASVIIVLLASVIPLFFSKELHAPFDFSWRHMLNKKKDILGYMGFGFDSGAALILWPIYIFFSILNSYALLGMVRSLSFFFSLTFLFIIGRATDVRRKLALRLGASMNAVVWIFRALVKTPIGVFVVDALYGITNISIIIPFNAISYDKSEHGLVEAIIVREVFIQIGRVLMLLIVIGLASLTSLFWFGGIGSMLFWLF